MNTPTKPTLHEVAQRNPAVTPDRVRQMQEVVKKLQERGLLKPSKYGIQPALGGYPPSFEGLQGLRMMNRVGDGD